MTVIRNVTKIHKCIPNIWLSFFQFCTLIILLITNCISNMSNQYPLLTTCREHSTVIQSRSSGHGRPWSYNCAGWSHISHSLAWCFSGKQTAVLLCADWEMSSWCADITRNDSAHDMLLHCHRSANLAPLGTVQQIGYCNLSRKFQ